MTFTVIVFHVRYLHPQVPCFLISHVRKMNEAAMGKKTPTSEKSKRRLLKRWNLEKDRDRSEVSAHGIEFG